MPTLKITYNEKKRINVTLCFSVVWVFNKLYRRVKKQTKYIIPEMLLLVNDTHTYTLLLSEEMCQQVVVIQKT